MQYANDIDSGRQNFQSSFALAIQIGHKCLTSAQYLLIIIQENFSSNSPGGGDSTPSVCVSVVFICSKPRMCSTHTLHLVQHFGKEFQIHLQCELKYIVSSGDSPPMTCAFYATKYSRKMRKGLKNQQMC